MDPYCLILKLGFYSAKSFIIFVIYEPVSERLLLSEFLTKKYYFTFLHCSVKHYVPQEKNIHARWRAHVNAFHKDRQTDRYQEKRNKHTKIRSKENDTSKVPMHRNSKNGGQASNVTLQLLFVAKLRFSTY